MAVTGTLVLLGYALRSVILSGEYLTPPSRSRRALEISKTRKSSMSSFKRKVNGKQTVLHPGTRTSPGSPSTVIISTGIPSLDDILGGGLPLSCSLVILAPDAYSSYGDLTQRYYIAQGLICSQRICVLGRDAKDFVKDTMWTPGVASAVPEATNSGNNSIEADDDDESAGQQHDQKIKIAWRYEQMKQFQTTVASSSAYVSLNDFLS